MANNRRKRSMMTEEDLQASVSSMIDDSQNFGIHERNTHREWAIRFYEGEVDIPASGDDRSTVVSRDVSDVHGMILPGLLRVFFSSDKVVLYEPSLPEHEEYAGLATSYINHVVMRECNGYRHFRNAFSDGLLLGNGIVKHWWDDTPVYKTERFTGLTEDEYLYLKQDPDNEIVEEESYIDADYAALLEEEQAVAAEEQATAAAEAQAASPPEEGMPPEGMPPEGMPPEMAPPPEDMAAPPLAPELPPVPSPVLYDVTVRIIEEPGRLKIACVPDEEFLIDKTALVLDETCRFAGHFQRKTRSELISEGYDRAKIEDLPAYSSWELRAERYIRDHEYDWATDVSPDDSTEYVDIYECYILIDYDGDGMAERRRIVMAGETGSRVILANEEWGDDLPFSDIVPNPRPHVWRGRGLYDDLKDIQRIKTVSLRGILDNTYQILNPQYEVDEGSVVNEDELVNPSFGGVVWKTRGSKPIVPMEKQFIGDNIFNVLGYMDEVSERRTGISKQSQALDMDAMQNQSATAVNAMQAAVHSKVEEYARNISDCGGMQRIFAAILKLITKHQDRAKMVRISGKMIPVDPSGWDARMSITINTGLGTGSRERDLASLMAISQKQEQFIMQAGPFTPFLNIGNLFDTYRKMAEASGLRNVDQYFPEVTEEMMQQAQAAMEGQEEPPDPKVQAMMVKAEIDKQKAQAQMQLEQMKAQIEAQVKQSEMQLKAQLEVQKAQSDQRMEEIRLASKAEIEQRQAEADMAVEQRRAEFQMQLERQKFEFQRELEILKATLEADINRSKLNATLMQNQQKTDAQVQLGQQKADAAAAQKQKVDA